MTTTIVAPDLPTTERFPLTVSVRGGRPVAARRDGGYFVTRQEVCLGLWHSRRDVTVLDDGPIA